MNLLKYLDTFLTTYHNYFPIARSITRTLLLILPKSTRIPERLISTILELLEIHHVIISSPPTFPLRSLALTSAMTVISPYVESLFTSTQMKYSFLLPIQSLRVYYSIQYFLKSGFSLIPSTNTMKLPLTSKQPTSALLTLQSRIFRIVSELIHSFKPLFVLISFSIFGDNSYVPLFISFILSCVEFICLYKNSSTFSLSELSIYRQRLTRVWVFFIFPVLISAYRCNPTICYLLRTKIPGVHYILGL
ncbi:hypothetical protein EDI_342190 [Entamoeba dispar SAW760]|uniref:Peroxisomal membrane protein PEX16 n=1 Tax=Entamoeba dispar (strain ATCC PRA-260 / SAW760) TaxID=370354 RepID=B0E9Q1_ENTDS|nr:uncharacterized protein EDI_342190 [Entamoeba dispar SAW760]EDR28769.1 hypothetical protein EDI_342190 [Entamoeba dispar SAW760]|eukprot:EDR28769.1 hypothetical protein EDI_342190 [Entamoeba dispar SAW760]